MSAPVPSSAPSRPWRPDLPVWAGRGLLVAGALVVTEGVAHLLAPEGGGLIAVGLAAGGWWLLSRRTAPTRPRLPDSLGGWIERCESLLHRFEQLEGEAGASGQQQRRQELERCRADRPGLSLAVTGSTAFPTALQGPFAAALRGSHHLTVHWAHPLPVRSPRWEWPAGFERCDLMLFHLPLPLQACDLRWLEAVPPGMPLWLLIPPLEGRDRQLVVQELISQWPAADPRRLLFWDGGSEGLPDGVAPLAAWLRQEAGGLRASTPRRCLEDLHRRWQAELEELRRREWRQLQQRTQWVVAAGVVAAPLPSLDLLVLAAANGLMLQEMARLWDCSWTLEQLRAAATELARACLAMGIVEWTSQALAGAVRLHGATWLVGGALQALSAAYLTRVVSHAMADVLALSAGVSEPDLERIKREAPLLVARAAEAEKVDWGSFLQQGKRWLQRQTQPGAPAMLHTAS